MPEFTGERVVPDLVEADLLNEHLARYLFAARFAEGKRVLDAACGAGYGAYELARTALEVTGIDISSEAIAFAARSYAAPNLRFETGDCAALPAGPFELVVAFEAIEHLEDWRGFLNQVRRVLAPGGVFLVSTPNRVYYTESRGASGANPFHAHEFDYAEFLAELSRVFPRVEMHLQNHVEGFAISPVEPSQAEAEVRPVAGAQAPDAHFFLAACYGSAEATAAPARPWLWIPGTGNILREREKHIARLKGELELKDEWLRKAKEEAQVLLQTVRELNLQLRERNRWALEMEQKAEGHGRRILELQEEARLEREASQAAVAGYEGKIRELEETNRAKTAWALETEARLTAEVQEKSGELARCVELLDRAEASVTERTEWALRLRNEMGELARQMAALRANWWVKIGGGLKLVPGPRR